MGMKLFDDETDNENIFNIEINKDFARRYEHNKKREDLQRYEELKKKGQIKESDSESDSESSDEEEDTEIKLSKKEDIKKLFENLIKIKEHHPSVYQPVKLFESESDSDNDMKDKNKDRRKKPKYLKDVVAQHLIEEGPEFDDVESNKMKKTYIEEQEELKKAFLDEVKNLEEDSDEGDLLKLKESKDENDGEDDDGEFQKKLGEYFGPDAALDENSKFLKDFFEKQMWIDRENKTLVDDDEVDVLLRDDEEVERQEKYEESYNFRYEENAGDRVMGHSRIVEGSVRKEKNARKEQRKNKIERLKIAEMERREELKHLKNLKKKEMKEKLMKVMEVAGVTDENDFGLDLADLEEDFDPAEYDKKMTKAFGDKYYSANDVDPEFGSDDDDGDIEKPDFGKEDELLGLPKGWDAGGNDDGFLATRKRALEKIAEDDNHDREEEDDDDNYDDEKEEMDSTDTEDNDDDEDKEEEERGTADEKDKEIVKKRKCKEKVSLVQRAKEAMLEEYYKLDYEDAIGDLKTRFKYAKVKPNRFGLKTEEVLMLDDKDLNQYVSVKKIAPYRENEWKVPNNKRREYKEKARELRRGKWNHGKTNKKKSSRDSDDKSKSVSDQERKQELEETDMEVANLSRKKKRKLRQKEFKLSKSRMAAYLNVQQKANGKRRKH